MLLNFILSLFFAPIVLAVSTKESDGYALGYLSDCPGSTKEAIIRRKSLKNLKFWFQAPADKLPIIYNYFQMKLLAKNPGLDFRKKTILYVGGYMGNPTFRVSVLMAAKYKELGYNVLLLDSNAFSTIEYPRAARMMRPVGKHSAEMLIDLTKEGLDPKKLEVVGLSLGGQTASFVAKNFQRLSNVSLSRITALEPAGPCFRHLGPEDRLDKGDADFVDVLYTNIDGLSMPTPIGHVNFYVNGGEYQPGELVNWALCDMFCSHIRAYKLWLLALDYPKSFIGIQCDSVQEARDRNCYKKDPQVTNVLGLDTIQDNQGIFYLATTNTKPFYLEEKGLKKENDFYLTYTKSFNDENVIRM